MNKRHIVFDASAVLAVLFQEPGADRVAGRVHGATISAANWSEVVAKLIDHGSSRDEVINDLANLDVEVVPVSREHAETAGLLRPATRSLGLSLGDRLSLALAAELGAVVITADRAWKDVELANVSIELIR